MFAYLLRVDGSKNTLNKALFVWRGLFEGSYIPVT